MGLYNILRPVLLEVFWDQGEYNANDCGWPQKVKSVYAILLRDLHLRTKCVPLLPGEVVNADEGGGCASMNKMIATLSQRISNL